MLEPALQIHPMVPLAKASAILKISRDELIQRLSSGELLGEKRRIGESKKDSWFIYAEEFDRLLAQALVKYEERISTRGLDHIFNQGKGQPAGASAKSARDASPPEMVSIEPVSRDFRNESPGQIVDALGVNYALGGDYDDDEVFHSAPLEPAAEAFSRERQVGDVRDFGAVGKIGETGEASETSETDESGHAAFEAESCLPEVSIDKPGTELRAGQAMVAQLVQHLQDARQFNESLKDRMALLEEEVEQLRREVLSRPDRQSHSILHHIKGYFRLLLGKST